jgi:hypothetical protein
VNNWTTRAIFSRTTAGAPGAWGTEMQSSPAALPHNPGAKTMTTPTKLHRRKDGTTVSISSALWHQLNGPNSKRAKKIAADMAKYQAAMAEKAEKVPPAGQLKYT